MKKIYLVTQSENDGYDTYDSFVCVADSEEQARNMLPTCAKWGREIRYAGSWAYEPSDVTVTEIDINNTGIVLESFNAG